MVWPEFLEIWNADPWWITGSLVLFAIVLGFYLFSFFRHIRTLGWFYGAGILGGILFFLFLSFLPVFFEYLASLRPDWSLVYLVRTWSLQALLSEFVVYGFLYGLLGMALTFLLAVWCLLSFSWNRFRILLQRASGFSWFLFFFSLFTLVVNRSWSLLVQDASMDDFQALMACVSFYFYIQLFLRFLDTARFHAFQIFFEFLFGLGFVILLLRFFTDWYFFFSAQTGTVHGLFLTHTYLFFLTVLFLGIFGTFLVRSFFASPFFLEQYHQKNSFFLWLSNLISLKKEAFHMHRCILTGVIIGISIGFFFLFVHANGWYLFEVLLFFAGYFVLFYLLDGQEDMRIRGDLVEKRINSGHHKSFFT